MVYIYILIYKHKHKLVAYLERLGKAICQAHVVYLVGMLK